MSTAARRIDTTAEITTEDGATARLERREDGESLAVRDRKGRLLFEYDAVSGRGTLVVPEGDLRLAAPKGSIEFVAAHDIRAACGGKLEIDAKESDLSLGEAKAVATSLHAVIDRAELRFAEVVRTAGRVIDEAENLYQRVGELYELKTGRLRALVKESLWMKGEDVTVLAKKEVRVDGERINLG
ncbi:MAG: DUF3540 domain-containing protein [Polyangiaceae bacterium]